MRGRYESLAGSETTKKKQSDKCVIGPQRAWQSTIGRTEKDYEPSRDGHLSQTSVEPLLMSGGGSKHLVTVMHV